jgi:regulatory protein
MPRITQIKPQKKPGRFNIFIDGEFALALSAEGILKEGLKVGQEISPEIISKLVKENELQINLDKVFKFLSFRPRSKKEILVFLKKKQLGEETEKAIFKKLEDLKMINDLDFAKWWVEQRKTFRPEGCRLLRLELQQKGIDQEVINQVLSLVNKEPEINLAKRVLDKKQRQFQGLTKGEFKKKAFNLLLRRGFSYETVRRAIEKELVKE